MAVALTNKPVRGESVRFRRYKDNLILIQGDVIYELNETAEMLWKLCNGENTFSEITAEIASEYGVEQDVVQQDLDELLDELIGLGMIEMA